jgi:hypothetical protein
MRGETKFTQKHPIVWFLVKKQVKNIVQTCLATFNFQDACHRQIADAIKRSNHGCLTVDKHRKQSIRVRSGDHGGLAIDSQLPIHLPGYITLNHSWISSLSALEFHQAWNQNLCLTATEPHLQTAPAKHFSENHNILKQWACEVADRGPWQRPWQFQPRLMPKQLDFIPMLGDSL